jgi:NADH-quinone oxidoreductase subunit J
MFCLASLFVMLGAFFVAALQVLLYAGAVLVLFLFVVMLLNLAPEELARLRPFTLRTVGTLTALFFCLNLVQILLSRQDGQPLGTLPAPAGGIEAVGRQLFTTYVLPFELISFLILAALIGAVTLAKQKSE